MQEFSFTAKEEFTLNNELDKLESMLLIKGESIFSVSKQDGIFSGSLKMSSSDIYTYGKSSTGLGLFYKLRERLKLKILKQNELMNIPIRTNN